MTKSDSKSGSSTNTPRVGRTIPLEEAMLNRTLLDALHDPIPFPRLAQSSENDTNAGIEQAQEEPNPSVPFRSRISPETVDALLTNLAEQQNVNDGQRKINGQLCRVDWMLVEVLRLLRVEIKKLPAAHQLDFERIDSILTHAYHTSAAVSDIKPPGCEPRQVADPNWEVTKTKVA